MTNVRIGFVLLLTCSACSNPTTVETAGGTDRWLLVDDFEAAQTLQGWTNIDAQNDTDPFVHNPQISEIQTEPESNNNYMLRKPAADGVLGNRKAIGFRSLPVPIRVGETYTLYTRINVEYFPNNQSFGLSNSSASDVPVHNYDALEPMIRITDKADPTQADKATIFIYAGENSRVNSTSLVMPYLEWGARCHSPTLWRYPIPVRTMRRMAMGCEV